MTLLADYDKGKHCVHVTVAIAVNTCHLETNVCTKTKILTLMALQTRDIHAE